LTPNLWDLSGTHVASSTSKNPRFTGVLRADDGTRTHDLLHGKRVVGSVVLRRNPFVHARLRLSVRFGSAAQMFAVSRRFVGVRAAKAACCPNIRHPTLPFARCGHAYREEVDSDIDYV
jgi:hypothetical protein